MGHLGWDHLVLGTLLSFLLEFLLDVRGQRLALMAWQGNPVAGSQKFWLGVDTLLGSSKVSLFVVIQVSTQSTKLVFIQPGGFKGDGGSIEQNVDLTGLQDKDMIQGLHNSANDVLAVIFNVDKLSALLTHINGPGAIDNNSDLRIVLVVSLRDELDLSLTKIDFDLFHSIRRGRLLARKNSKSVLAGTISTQEMVTVVSGELG